MNDDYALAYVFQFRPDENNDDWISYLSFKDLSESPVYVGQDVAVITPGAIRYAEVVEYDPEYSTYRVHYTSDNLTELA